MKVMQITQREALAMELRYADVRRFLETCDILQLTEIYREHQAVLTRDDMIDALMDMGQLTIDSIHRAEALDEQPFDADEMDQK